MTEKAIVSAISRAGERLGYILRPRQKEIVLAFVKGRDVFVSLPTGSGKSLCYAVLPWVYDLLRNQPVESSIILVVSPLIALMKDQVASLSRKGVRAMYIGEATEDDVKDEIHDGKYQVLFFSPESLLTAIMWRDMLQSSHYRRNLVAFVVDEAHCVKKWGERFRTAFAELGDVSSLLPPDVHTS